MHRSYIQCYWNGLIIFWLGFFFLHCGCAHDHFFSLWLTMTTASEAIWERGPYISHAKELKKQREKMPECLTLIAQPLRWLFFR